MANQNAGKRLFNWSFISEDGKPVESGAGLMFNADYGIYSDFPYDTVIIFSGNDPVSYLTKRFIGWIQRLAAHGVVVGGIDTGVFALAEAGLLSGRRATCHWEAMPLFAERYPEIELVERRFIIDPPYFSCAGGIAVLDLILDMIEREHGAVLARHISNGFVYPHKQRGEGPQRTTAASADPAAVDPVSRVIALMETNIEEPLPIASIAEETGLPRRKLERLFRRKTQTSIGQYYMRVRLEHAREMLFYGDDPVSEISLMCGFSSPAVFTRTFRDHFGQSPRDFRSSYSAVEMARFRPHVTWSLSESRDYKR